MIGLCRHPSGHWNGALARRPPATTPFVHALDTMGVTSEDPLMPGPPVRAPRPGVRLEVKGRPLPFSMWPVGRGIRRYGLSDYLFAKSPWAVVQGAIEARTAAPRRPQAVAFLDQSRSFFDAAHDRAVAAAPLLLYYAFLNLAKAFALSSGVAVSLVASREPGELSRA